MASVPIGEAKLAEDTVHAWSDDGDGMYRRSTGGAGLAIPVGWL